MTKNLVFNQAEIMIPENVDLSLWSVIACDQFTSDIGYWKEVDKITDGKPSTIDLTLPEVYLGTEYEKGKETAIAKAMNEVSKLDFLKFTGFVYVERTIPGGSVRKGVVGKIDLQKYNYVSGSSLPVRATEETVESRIPARRKIREKALYELPHVMIFVDSDCYIVKEAEKLSKNLEPTYDFDLMLGGGRIRGTALTGENADYLSNVTELYESSGKPLLYAIGDGNHSLAAAKSHFENVKKEIGPAALDHPSRYAMCEIVNIDDGSIQFEPIYRILFDCDPGDVIGEFRKITGAGGKQKITLITEKEQIKTSFTDPSHPLTVGTLQNFIDSYLKSHPDVKCDYIHGEEELVSLTKRKNNVGFIFDGIEKRDLFDYVSEHGPYPRKTFSMGDAKSKRYYLEMRKIK